MKDRLKYVYKIGIIAATLLFLLSGVNAEVNATETPTPVPTETPTPVPTETPTPVPTETPTPVPTEIPTPVPTEIPTPVPTEIPTPVPTEIMTPVPTPVNTPYQPEPYPTQTPYKPEPYPTQTPYQPGPYPGQPGPYPSQTPYQPGPYPGQPGPYPTQTPYQPGPYPGQPGPYPSQTPYQPYPGQPYPGQPYPGQPGPYPTPVTTPTEGSSFENAILIKDSVSGNFMGYPLYYKFSANASEKIMITRPIQGPNSALFVYDSSQMPVDFVNNMGSIEFEAPSTGDYYLELSGSNPGPFTIKLYTTGAGGSFNTAMLLENSSSGDIKPFGAIHYKFFVNAGEEVTITSTVGFLQVFDPSQFYVMCCYDKPGFVKFNADFSGEYYVVMKANNIMKYVLSISKKIPLPQQFPGPYPGMPGPYPGPYPGQPGPYPGQYPGQTDPGQYPTQTPVPGVTSTPTPTATPIPGAAIVSIANARTTPDSNVSTVIKIEGVKNISAATMILTYDPAVVNVLDVTEDDLGPVTKNINNTLGSTAMSAFTTSAQSGTVGFANVVLKAIGELNTSSPLTLSVQFLYDLNTEPIVYSTKSGTFTVSDIIKGDVNGDALVTIADALLLAQSTVGLRTLTGSQTAGADVNGDGLVTIADALFIAQYTVGLRASL